MPLLPGTRIGQYELGIPLGSGGMGEVYRARDSKLDRDVAIKVLPEAFAHDAGRLARFLREAKTLAALNHPNIAAIYGLEDSDGIKALVMELVEGDDLSQRISRGPVPIDEALPIAKQIAEALEAAHDQGIIHRDLKPANVKVRPDGTVKVLDFGLAKAMEAPGSASPSVSQAPTTNTPATMTGVGMILGTAAYMSPEQARGKAVDKRTDIWALGCVLFEMLTGQRAFGGEDVSEVMSRVLQREPDWAALPSGLSPTLVVYLKRCLHKDANHRVHDIGDIRLALDGAFETEAPMTTATSSSSMPTWTIGWIAFAIAVVSMIAMAVPLVQHLRETPPPASLTRFAITPSAALPLRLSLQSASRDFAVAPDGSFVVYRAGDQGQLVVRWFDRLEALPLPGVSSAVMPFVSPDSRWIGYAEDNLTLKKVAVNGGAPITLARLPVWPRGAAWVDDETIIIGTNSQTTGLLRVPAGGGEPTVLTAPDRAQGEEGHVLPAAVPGRQAVLFTIGAAQPEKAKIALLDLRTGQQRTLLDGGRDAQYVASGYLVYMVGLGMSAVRFDPSRLAVLGEPVRVLDGVATAPTGVLNVAVTAAGTLVFIPDGIANVTLRTLLWVDREGHETPLTAPPRPYESARLSPNGTRVVVSIRDQESDIWTWDLPRQTLTRLTFDPDVDISPVWSPDGRHVVFSSARTGVYNLYLRDVDGSASDVRLTSGANTTLPDSVTADGAYIIGHEVQPQTKSDLARVALDLASGETGPMKGIVETPFEEWNGEVSPDGRFLAYQSDESGRDEVYVRTYPEVATGRWQISSGGASAPAWIRGGRELVYLDRASHLTTVPVDTTGAVFHAGTPVTLVKTAYAAPVPWRTYDVSRDGQRFLVMKDAAGLSREASTPALVVVQNWQEELKRLVPTK